jgi:hypothetical protein
MQNPLDFTEQEIFQALRWGMDEPTARNYARLLSGSLDVAVAQPNDTTSVGYSNFSEDFLVLLSLVSEEARAKAEQRMMELHGRRLEPHEHAAWEKKRTEIRAALEREGKLRE